MEKNANFCRCRERTFSPPVCRAMIRLLQSRKPRDMRKLYNTKEKYILFRMKQRLLLTKILSSEGESLIAAHKEFCPPSSTRKKKAQCNPSNSRNIIATSRVAAVLDRVNITDRTLAKPNTSLGSWHFSCDISMSSMRRSCKREAT